MTPEKRDYSGSICAPDSAEPARQRTHRQATVRLLDAFYTNREKRLLSLARKSGRGRIPDQRDRKALLCGLAGELASALALPHDVHKAFLEARLAADRDPDLRDILHNGDASLETALLQLLMTSFPDLGTTALRIRLDLIACVLEGARIRFGSAHSVSFDFLRLWSDFLSALFPGTAE